MKVVRRAGLAGGMAVGALLAAPDALSQISIDGSANGGAGPLPLVGGTYSINSGLGRVSGSNLFHSFGAFSVQTGETANFTGAAGAIQNIIGRVTGGARSDIHGTVRVDAATLPGANLFLMNPAGFMFGPTATLDVQGSFHATTADYIGFANGDRFLANKDAGGSSFSASTPSSFGFLGPNANPIEIVGTQFAVPNGKTLSFVAQNVSVLADTANTTGAQFDAPQGTINVLAIGGAGELGLNGTSTAPYGGTVSMVGGPLQTMFPFTPAYVNRLDVGGDGGGTVRIRAGQIAITSTDISASNLGPLNSTGGIDIQANTIDLVGSKIGVSVVGSGNGASVSFYAADRFDLTQSDIGTDVAGTGKGGNLTVTVPGTITMRRSFFRAETANILGDPVGDAGNIIVTAGNLSLERRSDIDLPAGSGIFSDTFGVGRAGNISITLTGSLSMVTGLNEINSSAMGFTGKGGDISIAAANVVMSQAKIASETLAAGAAGTVSLAVGNLTMRDSSTISASTGEFGVTSATGNAGAISVNATGAIAMSDGSTITTQAFGGSGNAGAITISTGSLSMLSLSEINSVTQTAGAAGIVNLSGQSIALSNAGISTTSFGAGNAGSVFVTASGAITLSNGSGISSSAFDAGNAGVVSVSAGSLAMSGGANITTTSFGGATGRAGDIFVAVAGAMTMTDLNTFVQSQSLGENVAGNINVSAGSLTILKDAAITTDTTTNFNAGTIVVNVVGELLIDGTGHTSFVTGITSDAFGDPFNFGNAGSVTVTAGSIVLRNNAAIQSNTNTSGNAGSVVVTATGSILIDGSVHTLGTDFTGIASVANDTGEFTFSRAGSVTVTVGGDLVLLRNGQIATDTYTNGDAGTITITVAGTLVIDGNGQLGKITGIFSDSFVAAGNAGSINITAGAGRLSNFSKIATETAADGRGGDINALFGALQVDTGASISSTSSDKGNAGSVTVRSPGTITLMDLGTAVQSRATGTGDAGPVTIFADTLVLKSNAAITTEATVGGGGNITLIVNQLLYLLNSSITTTVAGGSGSGGDIFIDPIFVVLNHSTILARAFRGNGGNITINTQYFLASPDSIVDASSALGVNGQISISSPDTDLTTGLAQLPGGLLSTTPLEQRACVAPGETPTLSLVPTGRGGLALVLDESQSQPAFLMAGRPSAPVTASRAETQQLAEFRALPKAAPSSITCVH